MGNKMIVMHPGVERQAPSTRSNQALAPSLDRPASRDPLRGSVRATRLMTLAGARIAVIDNSKLNSDGFLDGLEGRLREQHGAGAIHRWRKGNSGRGAAFLEEVLAWQPDLVLNGIGD